MLDFLRLWSEYLAQTALPLALLVVDVVLRASLNLGVADAGADMTLVAVTGLTTLGLSEAFRPASSVAGPALLLAMFAFLIWVSTLVVLAQVHGLPSVVLCLSMGSLSLWLFVWLLRDVVSERQPNHAD